MKKIIILCLCLFITGCNAEQKEDVKSSNADVPSAEAYSWTSLNAQEYYPLRLEALREGKFEKVRIVHDFNSGIPGEELIITDSSELEKLEEYFNQLTWTNEIGSIGPSHSLAEFEIHVKDKGIIYLRFAEDALCDGQTRYLLDTAIPLDSLIHDLNGTIQKGINPSVISPFNEHESYADTILLDLSQITINTDQQSYLQFTYDIWNSTNDSLKYPLRIFNYIHENFTNYTDIQDQRLLISGLIQQSERYNCYNTEPGYCIHEESQDITAFPGLSNYSSMVSFVVPYGAVLNTGKRLFGEDFVLPNLNDGALTDKNYLTYEWLDDQQLFMYRVPSEALFWRGSQIVILEQEENENELYIKFVKAYLKNSIIGTYLIGYDNYQVSADNIDTIAEHQDHFEQWEAILKKTDTGYQVLSGKCLNPYETSYEADPTKPVVYRDEENDVQVNLSSVDALHFNRWVKNQENVTYKENIHENLLTVYVNGEDQFAVVFDLATNKALSPMEVKEYLQIDEEKLSAAYQAIPDVNYYNPLDNYFNPLFNLQATNLFIDSHGNPAMIQNNQVYLFTWEEVR